MSDGGRDLRWDVTSWAITDVEQQGADEKYWIRAPDERLWIWKPVTLTSSGHRQGEDWAEKAAASLAELLALPHAEIQLAHRSGHDGLISLDLRPPEYDLQSGGVLLSSVDADYRTAASLQAARSGGEVDPEVELLWKRRTGHSLPAIKRALSGYSAPPGCRLPPDLDAYDVFVGYLLLDAWISNRDRHDENWAVPTPRVAGVPRRLCGAYDKPAASAISSSPIAAAYY